MSKPHRDWERARGLRHITDREIPVLGANVSIAYVRWHLHAIRRPKTYEKVQLPIYSPSLHPDWIRSKRAVARRLTDDDVCTLFCFSRFPFPLHIEPLTKPRRPDLGHAGVDNGGLLAILHGTAGRASSLNGLDDLLGLVVGDLAEDDVATIQPGGRDGGDEELGAVALGAETSAMVFVGGVARYSQGVRAMVAEF